MTDTPQTEWLLKQSSEMAQLAKTLLVAEAKTRSDAAGMDTSHATVLLFNAGALATLGPCFMALIEMLERDGTSKKWESTARITLHLFDEYLAPHMAKTRRLLEEREGK